MLKLLNFFKKSSPKPTWHFTINPTYVGDKDKAIVYSLNKNHMIFSCKGCYHVVTPERIKIEHWEKLSRAFIDKKFVDKKVETKTDLVVLTELNETCDQVFSELSQEDELAGLSNIID